MKYFVQHFKINDNILIILEAEFWGFLIKKTKRLLLKKAKGLLNCSSQVWYTEIYMKFNARMCMTTDTYDKKTL